mgnify:CR=1 FL=1
MDDEAAKPNHPDHLPWERQGSLWGPVGREEAKRLNQRPWSEATSNLLQKPIMRFSWTDARLE